MKNPLRLRFLLGLAATLAGSSFAHGANGTWTNTAGGLWSASAPGNWASNIIADGTDNTADFSTIDLPTAATPPGTTTVNLDSTRTIGNLIFGDSDVSTAANWVLANNATPGNILTLDVTSGSPTITVNALGTNSTATISAVITGNDGLTKAGAGTLVLSAANSYTGATNVDQGTLAVSNSSALNGSAVTVASGARLQLQGSVNINSAVTLNGATSLFINGGNDTISGAVSLGSASTFSNTSTNNNSGTLSGPVNLNGLVLTVNFTGSSSSATISGTINGNASSGILKTGGSTLTLSNDQTGTYAGTTTFTGGGLAFGSDGALGTGTFSLGVNDNTISMRSTSTTARTLGNALQLLGNGNTIFTFGSTNASFTGALTFSNTSAIALGSTRRFVVNSLTEFDGGFTGSGVGIIKQTGTGVMILGGVNTYTGATTVNAGTLLVNGSLTATSAVTVALDASLGGTGTISGAATVNGSITPGNGLGTLTVTNDVTWNGTAGQDWKYELGLTSGSSDQLLLTGAGNDFLKGTGSTFRFDFLNTGVIGTFVLVDWADLATTSFSAADFSYTNLGGGLSGNFAINGSKLEFTTVPEPSAFALLGLGVFVLIQRRRVKRTF